MLQAFFRRFHPWAALWVLCLLLSLAFIRIYSKDVFFILPVGDDAGYFAYTEAMLRNHSLDWCKHPFFSLDLQKCLVDASTGLKVSPYNRYTIGAALVLLPVTAVGWAVSSITGFAGWMDPLFIWTYVGGFFCFWAGLILFFETAKFYSRNERSAFFLTVRFAIGNPVLYFVFRRPLLAHAPEFLVLAAVLFLLARFRGKAWGQLALGFLACLLLLVKLNDAFLIPFVALAILFPWNNLKQSFGKLLRLGLGALPVCATFHYVQYRQAGTFLYSPTRYDTTLTDINMFGLHSWTPFRIFELFFGPHWGMFWLSPALFLVFGFAWSARKSLLPWLQHYRWLAVGTFLIFAGHCLFLSNYPNNSMSYGNRYLLPFSILVSFFVAFLSRYVTLSRRAIGVGLVLGALGGFNVVNFESNAESLTLTKRTLGEEGIYDPRFSGAEFWVSPYFVRSSLLHTLSGQALLNFAVSPPAALAYLSLGSLSYPGKERLTDYYADRRLIKNFSDLAVLGSYYAAVLLYSLLLALAYFLLSRLLRAKNGASHEPGIR